MAGEFEGALDPEHQKPYEYRGAEIPPEFVDLFQTCLGAFEKVKNHFKIELDEMILEGFADEVSACVDASDVRGLFMQYFNQILEQYDLDMSAMGAGDVALIMDLLEHED